MVPFEIILAFIAVGCLATAIGGYAGFGGGIIAVTLFVFIPYPISTLIDSLAFISFIMLTIFLLISRTHGGIDWKEALLILCGCLIGTPLGYAFIVLFGNQPLFSLVLGATLVLFGIMGSTSIQPKNMAQQWAVPIGVASGFLGGAFLTGGPPIIMYLYSRTDEPQKMKATIQLIFLVTLIIRFASMFLSQATVDYANAITLTAWTLPFIIPILILSHYLSLRHSSQTFRQVVYWVVTLFGGIILTRALMHF